jgi:D-threo-aldose 1-dehydrogenase
MRIRQIRSTGVTVTELGFGAAPIGNLYAPVSKTQATAAVDSAWEAGIRYFDTAPHYGLGLSERRLGAALAGRPREQFVVSTKVGRLLVENPSPIGSDLPYGGFAVSDQLTRRLDYSSDGVRRSLDDSLLRLGLDHIDIVLVHDPVDHMDQVIDSTIPALLDLRDQGLIGAVGLGMNVWEPLRRAVIETDVDVVMIAGRWTLLDRSAEPLLEACASDGRAVLAAAPFNSGLLATAHPEETARFNYGAVSRRDLEQARFLAAACDDANVLLPQAALQFPLRNAQVVSVVAGMGSATQSLEDSALMSRPIRDEAWTRIDRAHASLATESL